MIDQLDSHDEFIALPSGITLHIRHWMGKGTPFVLLHGLASNCRTWDLVVRTLVDAGHRVVTVDQRGHGLSDKPALVCGYDFETMTEDLAALLDVLALYAPILVGQSWGGNVVLAFGARFPGRTRGLGFVDGGFLTLSARGSWEESVEALKPPSLAGISYDAIRARIANLHPDWTETAVEGTLANFEHLPDGTIRPWLTLDRHMAILRALWEQQPLDLMPLVREAVLICPARTGDSTWTAAKEVQVADAHAVLTRAQVHWFDDTDHDIHQHRPAALAALFLSALREGIWLDGGEIYHLADEVTNEMDQFYSPP